MRKLHYQTVKQEIESRGIKLLSKEYVNAHSKLDLECYTCGYDWPSNWSSIKQGKGCPQCAGNAPGSSEQLRKILNKIGYQLLTEYINDKTNVWVKCNHGHMYSVYPGSIKKGHRCKKCSFINNPNRKRYTINEIRTLAKNHNLICLDNTYQTCKHEMQFYCNECEQGFKCTLDNLIHGLQWRCSRCSSFLHESVCRSYFEHFFNKPFKKSRPDWLNNRNGNRLELDGYNAELGIAFEYNGRHHYQKNAYFNKSPRDHSKLNQNDSLKEDICSNHGVILIVIDHTIPLEEIGNLIQRQLKIHKFHIAESLLPLWQSEHSKYNRQKLNEIREEAKRRGWEFNSLRYVNCRHKLKFVCNIGHNLFMNSNNFLSGKRGCAECAKVSRRLKNRYPFCYYQDLAIKNGFRCLTTEEEYINCKEPMEWQCDNGHIWKAPGDYITQGYWCPKC